MSEKSHQQPLSNSDDGIRDSQGRFVRGNPGGPGNPQSRRAVKWRQALLFAVSYEDIVAVVRCLVKAARAGQPWAVKELLDRCLGRDLPAEADADPSDHPSRPFVTWAQMFSLATDIGHLLHGLALGERLRE